MTLSLLLKWTLLVWLNAAMSFYLALNTHTTALDTAGICFAVFTFVAAYAYLDLYLCQIERFDLSVQLLWSALLKSLTQFVAIIEILTGSLSVSFIKKTIGLDIPFISSYLITIVDGILLSCCVLLIMPFAKLAYCALQHLSHKLPFLLEDNQSNTAK